MDLHIAELCNVIEELNSDKSRHCLDPVCEFGNDWVVDLYRTDEENPTMLPTQIIATVEDESGVPSSGPSMMPTQIIATDEDESGVSSSGPTWLVPFLTLYIVLS